MNTNETQLNAKILVVDDNKFNRNLLEYNLIDEGYRIVTANDGKQALALASSERPDVILLDVMMPEIDGIEVCRRLKLDAETRAIPVIMVSAKSQDDDVVEGLDAGCDDYATKPIDRAKLFQMIEAHMSARSAACATIADAEVHRVGATG